MNSSSPWDSITFGQVAVSVVTFGALLALGFYEASTRDNILFHQVLNTVRVTMVLFGVAMCLFVLPGTSDQRTTYWLLFWTVSFLSYVVHVFVAFGFYFHASFSEFYGAQGAFVATTNLVITVWWLLDVVLSWTTIRAAWVTTQRIGIHVLILLTFFVSTVIFHAADNKETIVIVLGVLQALAVLICYVIRLRTPKGSQMQISS
jgi:hypothetical protein